MNKRYKLMLKMWLIKSPMKRAQYLKEHKVFKSCGDRVMITSRKIPLYPELISIGNNVWMASGVQFITHDVTHFMLNGLETNETKRKYLEKVGCIQIGDNVFIGANAQILYDVKIGSNVVIAAGSIVTKDVPDNSIVGGVPAKVLCTFEEYIEKRKTFHMEHLPNNVTQTVSELCVKEAWEKFEQKHNNNYQS